MACIPSRRSVSSLCAIPFNTSSSVVAGQLAPPSAVLSCVLSRRLTRRASARYLSSAPIGDRSFPSSSAYLRATAPIWILVSSRGSISEPLRTLRMLTLRDDLAYAVSCVHHPLSLCTTACFVRGALCWRLFLNSVGLCIVCMPNLRERTTDCTASIYEPLYKMYMLSRASAPLTRACRTLEPLRAMRMLCQRRVKRT